MTFSESDLFNKPLSEVTFRDVEQFVQSHPEESLHFDYKDKSFIKSVKITKAISAFANSDGGLLIIGVKSPGEGNHAPTCIDPITEDISKDSFLQAVVDKIEPPIRNIRVYTVYKPDNSGFLFIVFVPASSEAPHMAGDHVYYQRIESRSVPMEHYQVQRSFFSVTSPNLEPQIRLERFGDQLYLSYKIYNRSKAICKWPFIKVSVFNLVINDEIQSSLPLNVDRNSIEYAPPNRVIYGNTNILVFMCPINPLYDFVVKSILAGENMNTSVFCSFIDPQENISKPIQNCEFNNEVDIQKFVDEYGLCNRGIELLRVFSELYSECQGLPYYKYTERGKSQIDEIVMKKFGHSDRT